MTLAAGGIAARPPRAGRGARDDTRWRRTDTGAIT